MPNNSNDYIGDEWSIDELTRYLTEIGFTNIKTVACDPDDDNFRYNIFELYIKSELQSTDSWCVNEEYDSDAEISIYYNEFPLLNTENCPDLNKILNSNDIGYWTFANTYDGRYVEFDAIVFSHLTYDGGTSHIIDVTGKLDVNGDARGLIIRAGDRTFGNDYSTSVKEGELVSVSGKIDLSWCEYYKQLYIETQS